MFYTKKLIIFIKYIYDMYLYVYKSFSSTLDKGLRKNIKEKEEMEKLENKLNEMGALNMNLKK